MVGQEGHFTSGDQGEPVRSGREALRGRPRKAGGKYTSSWLQVVRGWLSRRKREGSVD